MNTLNSPLHSFELMKIKNEFEGGCDKRSHPKTFQTVNIYLPETFDSGNEVSQFCPITNTVTIRINPFFSHQVVFYSFLYNPNGIFECHVPDQQERGIVSVSFGD